MIEIWKNYKEKYDASNFGRIRNNVRNRILTSFIRNGYPSVGISINNVSQLQTIHRIVAETYIPNPNNLPQVNHKNGIKTDNRVENLEWISASENIKHAINTGLINIVKGEKNGRSKLTELQVKEIKELKGIMLIEEIAKMFNCCIATVSLIHNNKIWKHLL